MLARLSLGIQPILSREVQWAQGARRLAAWTRALLGRLLRRALVALADGPLGVKCRVRIVGLQLQSLLLDHGHVLATGLALGFIGGARHVEGDADDNLGMQRNADGVEAEGLDRLVEHRLPAVDAEATGGDDLDDVARRHRAVELTGVAGLTNGSEALALELGGHCLRLLLQFEVARFQLGAVRFEALEVLLCGAQRLLLRQQEVAGIAVLDVDDIAHLPEAADALQKYDLHGGAPFSYRGRGWVSGFQANGGGGAPRRCLSFSIGSSSPAPMIRKVASGVIAAAAAGATRGSSRLA